jgi:hypothetical protein
VEENAYFLDSIRDGVERQAVAMPSHEAFIAQHCRASMHAAVAR